jgi:Triosephosphate isomerase
MILISDQQHAAAIALLICFVIQVGNALYRVGGSGTRQVTAMVGKGRFFVGGNWKCNETTAEVQKLVSELNDGEVPSDIEIVVAPTYIHLQMVGA